MSRLVATAVVSDPGAGVVAPGWAGRGGDGERPPHVDDVGIAQMASAGLGDGPARVEDSRVSSGVSELLLCDLGERVPRLDDHQALIATVAAGLVCLLFGAV